MLNPELFRSQGPLTPSSSEKINEFSIKTGSPALTPQASTYILKVIKKTLSASSDSLSRKPFKWLSKQLMKAVRFFFPTKQDIIDRRVSNFNDALDSGKKDITLAIEGGKKIPYEDMKALSEVWLQSSLGEAIEREPLSTLFRLMAELADGDMADDLRSEIKQSILDILSDNKAIFKKEYPLLQPAVKYFIKVFDEEKTFENSFIPTHTQATLQTLLDHSNLLKRKDVADVVLSMPDSTLRQQVLEKMNQVSMRVLNKAQNREIEILESLPQQLHSLSFQDIQQRYLSQPEMNYVMDRLIVVEKKINDLAGIETFDLRILQFEKQHLEKQKKLIEDAQKTIIDIGANAVNSIPPMVSNANDIMAQERFKFREMLLKRSGQSLQLISQTIPEIKNEMIRNQLTADFKKISSGYENLKELRGEEFLNSSIALTQDLQSLETFMLMHLPNRSEYLSAVNALSIEYNQLKTHLDDIHKLSSPWKELNEIKTIQERNAERENALAKDVIRLSLEKKGECQLPLKLTHRDARTYQIPQTSEDGLLEIQLNRHATEFIDSVQAKNLDAVKAKLSSLRQYTTDVSDGKPFSQLDPTMNKVAKQEDKPFDFEHYSLGMDITEPLKKWHHDLQTLWIEHMPREQEKTLLAMKDKQKRTQKMGEFFSAWLLEKTGTKLITPVSFEEIQTSDLTFLRKKQFKTIGPVIDKFREKISNKPFPKKETEEIHTRAKYALAKLVITKMANGKLSYAEKAQEQLYRDIISQRELSKAILSQPEFAMARDDKNLFPDVLPPLKGIDTSLIERNPLKFNLESVNFFKIEYKNMKAGSIANANPIQALTEAHFKIFGNPVKLSIDNRIQWIKELANNPKLQPLTDLRFVITNECHELAKASFEAEVEIPIEIQTIFLNQYRFGDQKNPPLDFSNLNNSELDLFFNTFILFNFSGKAVHNLTNQQRYMLIQFCALSKLSEKQINDVLKKMTNFDGPSTLLLSDPFTEVGKKIQETSVGLEGMEESAVQKSYQKSTLLATPAGRAELDFWRARSGIALQSDLFRYSIDIKDFNHDQERNAIERTLTAAFKASPEKGIAYLKKALEVTGADALNPHTMAPPVRIFYLDCLLKFSPKDQAALDEVQAFNESLIKNKNVNQMVMGFSREIVRLSRDISELSDEDCAKLIKYKLAYQDLKLKHFHNKVAIVGFLKAATDAADVMMVNTTPAMQKKLNEPDYLNQLRPFFLKNIFAEERFADKLIKDVFKDKEDIPLVNDKQIPSFFSLGENIQIDAVQGLLYYNGSQKISLPGHLQNHPDMRKLGLHSLPYSQDIPGGPFVYYTIINGKKVAQVVISEEDGQPIIQKRLSVDFEKNDKIKQLQFIPREHLKIPYALAHRMDIKDFWIDSDDVIYGYKAQSDLGVILKEKEIATPFWRKPSKEWNIQTKEGTEYVFLSDEVIVKHQSHPVLKSLLASLNPNEILINWEKETFYIPSLDLTISKSKNKQNHEISWKCAGKGYTGKVLDVDAGSKSYLALKNEGSREKVQPIKKELDLAKRKLKEMHASGLSNLKKFEVKNQEKEVSRLENALNEVEGRVVLTTLPETHIELVGSAYNKLRNDLIPAKFQIQFDDYIKVNAFPVLKYRFEVYPLTLEFINNQLKKNYKISLVNDTPENQEDYEALLKAYNNIQHEAEEICDHRSEFVLYNQSDDQSITSKDLSGALALILTRGNPSLLLKELSKYPITQSLPDSQLKLLETASSLVQQQAIHKPSLHQLQAYLALLEYQNASYQIQELAHSTLSDKLDQTNDINAHFKLLSKRCNTLLKRLDAVAPEVYSLWKKTDLAPDKLAAFSIPEPPAISIEKKGKSIVSQELAYLSQESLLERFFSTDKITSIRKNPEVELSPQHKALIKSFQIHTPDQVAGFYLEELGCFDLNSFYSEFRIDQTTGIGLYGVKKEDIESLFKYLEKERYISQNGGETRYSLTTAEKATALFHKDQVRAWLADRFLSEEQIQKITERLQPFLVKAMQSGFNFSIKDKQSEIELRKKLEAEKENHLQKYLDAEAIIKEQLDPYGISLVDLKYAVLSGDYGSISTHIAPEQLPRLRNALTRYLFHKTEMQHIANTLNAPSSGERNIVELLQTKRNYNIDKLLQEDLTGKEKEEQIIQRAFLVFEEDYGFRCNAMQIKMFRSLLLDSSHPEAIDAAQARMGFGKTALLPLMAIVRVAIERSNKVEDKHLVRYIVPRAVIEDNTSSFNQRLSAVTGGHVVKDSDFTRYQIDKINPSLSFDFIMDDLNKRLLFYEETINSGNVLIQWPEIRGSMEAQELDFDEMLIQGNLTSELEDKCLQCKMLLGGIRSIATYSIFDELDDTQDVKSREVNYTRGEKTPIPLSTIRPMEKLVSFIETQDDWKNLRAVAKEMLIKVADFKPDQITEPLLDYLTNRNSGLDEDLKQFLSEPLRNYLDGKGTSNIHTEKDSSIFLIRAMLLDPNMLSLAKSKQPNTHFGARFIEKEGQRVFFNDPDSQSALLIAVPYEGTNTPKGLSIFDNTEVAGITTMRYYLSKETQFSESPHLDLLIKQVRRNSIPSDLAAYYLKDVRNSEGQNPIDQLKEMAMMLDLEELKQAKDRFYKDFMENPSDDFRKFFAMTVVATQIRSDAACAKSDRYEKGSPNSVEKGCSGTVGGTSSYFVKQENDAAADGKLSLEIMGRASNSIVKALLPPQAKADYLNEILTTLLENCNENTRAIVDAAGMCKSKDGTPETVVATLWKHLQNTKKISGIEGIIYYGKDGVKRLYRGPNFPAIPCTTVMELMALISKKYFSFYGQKNTRGSDIKQANGAHALVTIDENVSNSDAKQAILRFRNLVSRDSGQTFSFACMPSYIKIIKELLKVEMTKTIENSVKERKLLENQLTTLKKEDPEHQKIKDGITALETQILNLQSKITMIDSKTIEGKEISNFLRLQEKNQEEKEALTIFKKEMNAHIKQAAAHLENDIRSQLSKPLDDNQKKAYLAFLKERNKISAFVERSIDNLHDKYGSASIDQSRNAFIEAQKTVAIQKLNNLFNETQKFARDVKCSVRLTRENYVENIDRSIELFKNRFDEQTPIQVTAINSAAIATAEALAEALAQAQAEAEGLAEKLSENVVEVEDRITHPQIETTTERHLEISLKFLDNDSLRHPITAFSPIKKLIKPKLRDKFQVSDFLHKNQNMVSHFILEKPGFPYLFIAQEEADLFKKALLKNNDNALNGYTLFDARTLRNIPIEAPLQKINDDDAKQILCAVFGDNGVPNDPIPTTTELRQTKLTNVESDQLLPHLEIDTENSTLLKNYVNLTQFGLKNPVEVNLNISQVAVSSGEAVQINIATDDFKGSIDIPKNNPYIKKYINQVYNEENITGKMGVVQDRIKEEYGALAAKLKELEEQQKLLEAKKIQLKGILGDPQIGHFNVTEEMRKGLVSRDEEFIEDRNDPIQGAYGGEFIKGLDQINIARTNFQISPSSANLTVLKNAFNDFANINNLSKIDLNTYDKNALFSEFEWNQHLGSPSSQMTPLEKVYGRILYSVHDGKIPEAKSCYRLDCSCMFNQTLPALIQSVTKLSKTIAQIEEIEKQSKLIEDQIASINAQIPKELLEAVVILKTIVDQQPNIEENLAKHGIQFAQKNALFDRFNLANYTDWEEPIAAKIEGILPDYKNVVQEGMEESYLKAIRALTKEEKEVLDQNKLFLRNVLNLAAKVEPRTNEVKTHSALKAQ